MSRIIGIDLGTTNSVVAVMDSGMNLVVADASGQRITPSVVFFPKDGEPLVGTPANRQRALETDRTIYSTKRFMGKRGYEIPAEDMVVTYPVTGDGEGPNCKRSSPPHGLRILHNNEIRNFARGFTFFVKSEPRSAQFHPHQKPVQNLPTPGGRA